MGHLKLFAKKKKQKPKISERTLSPKRRRIKIFTRIAGANAGTSANGIAAQCTIVMDGGLQIGMMAFAALIIGHGVQIGILQCGYFVL